MSAQKPPSELRVGHVITWALAEFQIRVVDGVRLTVTRGHISTCPPLHIRTLPLKASMAPAVHDSDSDASDAEMSPRKSKSQAESPERRSDQTSPEQSEEEEEDGEVYEIEMILDAKRGATGSVRFLKHSLEDARLIIPFKGKDRLPR